MAAYTKSSHHTLLPPNESIKTENLEKDKMFHAILKPSEFNCGICKNFKSDCKLSIHQHFRSMHCQSTNNFTEGSEIQCDNCALTTHCNIYLTKHQIDCKKLMNEHYPIQMKAEVEHRPKITWFSCEYCSYKVKSKNSLKVHMHNKHTSFNEMNWLMCDQCSYRTKVNYKLKRHKKLRHDVLEDYNLIKCEQCSYIADSYYLIQMHRKHRHAPKDWFRCEQCEFQTKHHGNIKIHMLNQHAPSDKIETWFHCKQCSYKTQVKEHFHVHFKNLHVSSSEDDCEQYFKESCEIDATESDHDIAGPSVVNVEDSKSNVESLDGKEIPKTPQQVATEIRNLEEHLRRKKKQMKLIEAKVEIQKQILASMKKLCDLFY